MDDLEPRVFLLPVRVPLLPVRIPPTLGAGMGWVLHNAHRVGMQLTRDEVAALLQRAQEKMREARQTQRKLRTVQRRVARALAGTIPIPPKRKSPK